MQKNFLHQPLLTRNHCFSNLLGMLSEENENEKVIIIFSQIDPEIYNGKPHENYYK